MKIISLNTTDLNNLQEIPIYHGNSWLNKDNQMIEFNGSIFFNIHKIVVDKNKYHKHLVIVNKWLNDVCIHTFNDDSILEINVAKGIYSIK